MLLYLNYARGQFHNDPTHLAHTLRAAYTHSPTVFSGLLALLSIPLGKVHKLADL